VSYLPDELGAIVDASGEVIDVTPAAPREQQPPDREQIFLTDEHREDLEGRVAGLTDEQREGVKVFWREQHLPPIAKANDALYEQMVWVIEKVLLLDAPDVDHPESQTPSAPADANAQTLTECRTCGKPRLVNDEGYCESCEPY
jgi:hypothetical protein